MNKTKERNMFREHIVINHEKDLFFNSARMFTTFVL